MSSNTIPSEASQLAILASDAPLHDKAVACQHLANVAGPKSVAPLAALLVDEKLADYARGGLEVIADGSASQALLDAIPALDGRRLSGVVNSLGVRREPRAVPVLRELAADKSRGVQEEALASLGMIATREAAAALQAMVDDKSGKLRTAAGHASLVAVARLKRAGKGEAAAGLLATLKEAFPEGTIHEAVGRLAGASGA